ncbi:MAG: peptidase, partial [Spirochaetales bacterium]|nr:peptidase [Spirochaetales bacterium]
MKKVLMITMTILLVGALFVSCGGKKEAAQVTTPAPAAAPAAAPATPTPTPAAAA